MGSNILRSEMELSVGKLTGLGRCISGIIVGVISLCEMAAFQTSSPLSNLLARDSSIHRYEVSIYLRDTPSKHSVIKVGVLCSALKCKSDRAHIFCVFALQTLNVVSMSYRVQTQSVFGIPTCAYSILSLGSWMRQWLPVIGFHRSVSSDHWLIFGSERRWCA
jgi:hypothetical protein